MCINFLKSRSGKVMCCYDSIYMIFWKRQNYEDSKKSSGCQESGYEGMNKQGTEDFYSQVTILYETLTVNFSKLIEYTSPRVKHTV